MAWQDTLKVRLFGWTKIPMIAYLRPRVLEAGDRVVVSIRNGRRARNHHKSMYFGALSVGADLAAGYMAMERIRQTGRRVSFVFQSVQADFLRRPDGTVHFTCEDGAAVAAVIDKTIATGEREAIDVPVVCTVPSHSEEPVARFVMRLSVKAK